MHCLTRTARSCHLRRSSRDAVVSDAAVYARANADPEQWWAESAAQLMWRRRWDTVLDWTDAPVAKWFVGGTLNVTESCLDRTPREHPDRVAYYWEGEPGDRRTITYRELHRGGLPVRERTRRTRRRKGRPSRDLHGHGPRAPDRAAGVRSTRRRALGRLRGLLCRGARRSDQRRRVPRSLDHLRRGVASGQVVPLKEMADEAVATTPVDRLRRRRASLRNAHRHGPRARPLLRRDRQGRSPNTEQPSSATARTPCSCSTPRGRRTSEGDRPHAGRLSRRHRNDASKMVFDLHAETRRLLVHRRRRVGDRATATSSTDRSQTGRRRCSTRVRRRRPIGTGSGTIVERYKVTILYTAPTAIRTFMKWGDEYLDRHDLSSLRILGHRR